MKIISLEQIRAALDVDAAIEAVADGFRAHSSGTVQLSAVGHLAFPDVHGDCHIKAATIAGSSVFAVKVATGFYNNAARGLPTSNGFVAVLDTHTGAPLALLMDEGWLTDMRTAMAGAVAARRIAPARSGPVGVVGTGIQAGMQARMIARATGRREILIWGRSHEKAVMLADSLTHDGFSTAVADDLHQLCAASAIIVTTTPSREPLITTQMLPRGCRVIAVGADAPGKVELEAAVLGAADLVVVDSVEQCVSHGETSWAVAAGLLDVAQLVQLGHLISDDRIIGPNDTVIVDLTGLGVQDLQIARCVWDRLA